MSTTAFARRARANGGEAARGAARAAFWTVARCLLALACVLGPAPAAARAPTARLVVLVVVDQMRGSELDCSRVAPGGGFARLCQEGRVFRQAALGHGLTETASGHATLATGAPPRLHGVLDKKLYDRRGHVLRDVCALRGAATAPGHPGCDADALLLPTLGERLLRQRRGSRSVALAAKGRSANLLAGRRASVVAWDAGEEPPALVGRRRHGTGLPRWLHAAWAQEAAAKPYVGWSVPPATWTGGPRETCDCGFSLGFGAPLPEGCSAQRHHDAWLSSPQSDAAVVGMALAAQRSLGLGGGPAPDLLQISLGATDRIGHCYGPKGPEREAVLAGVDAQLARLLAGLGEAVPQGLVVAVPSDHGMMPHLRDADRAGRRTGTLSTAEAEAMLERALAPWTPAENASLGALLRYPFVFLPPTLRGPTRRPAAAAVAQAFAAHPAVWRAWTAESLHQDGHPVAQLMAASHHPTRGGDVVLALRPYHRPVEVTPKEGSFACGSRHGSPWRYDRRVPLALWGEQVAPAWVDDAVELTQLTSSLSAYLGVAPARWAAPELP